MAGGASGADGRPEPVVLGERVALWRPTRSTEREFLRAVAASRSLHQPWVAPPGDPESYDAYLTRMGRDDHVGFVVRCVERGALVGVVNINNVVRGSFRSGQLGYYAFVGGAGRGLMTEGLRLVVAHAFDVLGLHRLEANIQPANVASVALAVRVGFRLEGFSPGYLFIDGAWRDHERWAILADEDN